MNWSNRNGEIGAHRVVTGGEAARFLIALKSELELMS
jgi:hypothetical protein